MEGVTDCKQIKWVNERKVEIEIQMRVEERETDFLLYVKKMFMMNYYDDLKNENKLYSFIYIN